VADQRSRTETFRIDPSQLIGTVKRLIHEGNIRRIVVKQNDRTVVEFPLTVGVVGTALAPMLAAVGALAALLTECTIEVERIVSEERSGKESTTRPR
jgi:hypothetical protein